MPSYNEDDLASIFTAFVRQKGVEKGMVPLETAVTDDGVTVTFAVLGEDGDTGERVNVYASRSDIAEQIKHPIRFDEFLARAQTPAWDAARKIREVHKEKVEKDKRERGVR